MFRGPVIPGSTQPHDQTLSGETLLALTATFRSAAPTPDTPQRSARRWLSVVTHLDPRYGGLSAVVPQLSTAVAAQGRVSVALAAFCTPGELYSAENFAQLTLTEWPASRAAWLRDRALLARFRTLLAQADGVHIHGLWEQSTLVAARGARQQRIPYILSAHGMLEPWALRNKQLKKTLYSAFFERSNLEGAGCLHALTRAEAQDYRSYGCTAPIAIIPNGVRIPATISSEAFFTHFPALRGKRIVLFLGRIHFKKGLDLLLRAWKKISARWPQTHLVLAGPDFEGTRARMTALVEQEALGESVLFTGMLRDDLKWSALAAAEGFVLPSFSEGLSVSVLEAMGVGLPVIVSEQCNLPEVADLEAGWVIPAAAGPLKQALEALLENSPQTNAAIGARGRDFVRRRYTWSVVARQMDEIYDWVQGGPTPVDVDLLPAERVR